MIFVEETMRTRIGGFAALALLLLPGCGGNSVTPSGKSSGNPDTPTTNYTITDLGAVGYYYGYNYGNYYYATSEGVIYGLTQGAMVSVNAAEQVVSTVTNNAVVWQNGVLTQLSPINSGAAALNDNGEIVGYATGANYTTLATVWQNGQQTSLALPLGGAYSSAAGVNAAGTVVGEYQVRSSNSYFWHAILWQNGTPTDLGTLSNGQYSLATAINVSNQVVGWSNVSATTFVTHAFVWQNGQMQDLGTLPGGTASEANAINDSGEIVGSSDSPAQGLFGFRALRAVAWTGTQIQDLGTLGGPGAIAFGINNLGQVVGTADTTMIDNDIPPYSGTDGGGAGTGGTGGTTSAGSSNPISGGAGSALTNSRSLNGKTRGIGDTYVSHAFLYVGGTMVDLNSRISSSSGWELIQATGINANGVIVGFGSLGKRIHAYLLTPQ
jgi:probable HAF family extracellular repeat protein